MGFGDGAEDFREAAVAVGEVQIPKEPWQALVEHRDALSAGGVRERAAKPSLSHTAGAGEDQIVPVRDPFAAQQGLAQRINDQILQR